MAKKYHTVKKIGETFCSVAVANGFKNCARLRTEGDNVRNFSTNRPAHQKWVLKVGDDVEIPATVPEDERADPEVVNTYQRRGLPIARIQFIRDFAEKPTNQSYRGRILGELNISNYVTTKAGPDEQAPFAHHNEKRAEHDDDALMDEDVFKVEVIDCRTPSHELDVHIEALKPNYEGTGQLHVVVAGCNTLEGIAKQYGNSEWKRIRKRIAKHRLNKDFWKRNPDPNRLTVGDQLFIPKRIVTPENGRSHSPFEGTPKRTAGAVGSGERGKRSLALKLERVIVPPPGGAAEAPPEEEISLDAEDDAVPDLGFGDVPGIAAADDAAPAPAAPPPGATWYFRSCYIRLVADECDQRLRAKQTLLVTDCYGLNGVTDDRVEILDQNVWAEYPLHDCPGDPKCRAVREIPINRGKEVDLYIHVLREAANGRKGGEGVDGDDGVVDLENARKRVQVYCRRIWAQAHVKFNIGRLETVDLPSNMLSVGYSADAPPKETANSSHGKRDGVTEKGKIGFTINVQRFNGAPAPADKTIGPILVEGGKTPDKTATLLKKEIDKLEGLSAKVSVNPKVIRNPRGSADVLITDAKGGRITITDLTPSNEQDRDQKVIKTSLTTSIARWCNGDNYHVGHPDQRNLVKFLGTADKVIDIYVIESVANSVECRGSTVCEQRSFSKTLRPLRELQNTILMVKQSIDTADTHAEKETLAHEIGHILFDASLHETVNNRLMFGVSRMAGALNDSKRITSHVPPTGNMDLGREISDGAEGAGAFGGGNVVPCNLVARMQRESADLMHGL